MKICTLAFPIRDGRVTLAPKKWKVGAGLLNGYGGKMEPQDGGEVDRTNVREFCEESGARGWEHDMEKVAIVDFFKASEHIFQCHVYICHDWHGNICETNEMGPPEEFFSSAPPLDRMMPGDRHWLEKVFGGEKIRAKVFYNADNTEVLDFQYEPLE